MINRQPKHWVLVADSGQARILELRRKPYEFRLVSELESRTRHLTSHELDSDASGRAYHVQGPGSHAKEPRADAHEQAEEAFVRSLSKALEHAERLGSFELLDVIADARTLGRLRRCLSPGVAERLSSEHRLDLSRLPLNDLEGRVRTVLGWAH